MFDLMEEIELFTLDRSFPMNIAFWNPFKDSWSGGSALKAVASGGISELDKDHVSKIIDPLNVSSWVDEVFDPFDFSDELTRLSDKWGLDKAGIDLGSIVKFENHQLEKWMDMAKEEPWRMLADPWTTSMIADAMGEDKFVDYMGRPAKETHESAAAEGIDSSTSALSHNIAAAVVGGATVGGAVGATGGTGSTVADSAVVGATTGAGTNLDKDSDTILDAAISGGISGGVGAATNSLKGLEYLDNPVGRTVAESVAAGAAAEAQGGDFQSAALAKAMETGVTEAFQFLKGAFDNPEQLNTESYGEGIIQAPVTQPTQTQDTGGDVMSTDYTLDYGGSTIPDMDYSLDYQTPDILTTPIDLGDYSNDYALNYNNDFSGYTLLDPEYSDFINNQALGEFDVRGQTLSSLGLTEDIGLDIDYDMELDASTWETVKGKLSDVISAGGDLAGKAVAWLQANPKLALALFAGGASYFDGKDKGSSGTVGPSGWIDFDLSDTSNNPYAALIAGPQRTMTHTPGDSPSQYVDPNLLNPSSWERSPIGWSPEQVEQTAVDLYNQGMSPQEIANLAAQHEVPYSRMMDIFGEGFAPEIDTAYTAGHALPDRPENIAEWTPDMLTNQAGLLYNQGMSPQEIAQLAAQHGVPYENMNYTFGDEYSQDILPAYGRGMTQQANVDPSLADRFGWMDDNSTTNRIYQQNANEQLRKAIEEKKMKQSPLQMAAGGMVRRYAEGGAVADADVAAWLQQNDGASDVQVRLAMDQYGVSPEQMARVTGMDTGAIQSRYDATTGQRDPHSAQYTHQYDNGVVQSRTRDNHYTSLTPESTGRDIGQAYKMYITDEGGPSGQRHTQERMDAAAQYLRDTGVDDQRIMDGYDYFLRHNYGDATDPITGYSADRGTNNPEIDDYQELVNSGGRASLGDYNTSVWERYYDEYGVPEAHAAGWARTPESRLTDYARNYLSGRQSPTPDMTPDPVRDPSTLDVGAYDNNPQSPTQPIVYPTQPQPTVPDYGYQAPPGQQQPTYQPPTVPQQQPMGYANYTPQGIQFEPYQMPNMPQAVNLHPGIYDWLPQNPLQGANWFQNLPDYSFAEGGPVAGPGTGRSDEIPALLSDGEFVIDAETVALLGDGSTEAGARILEQLREEIRRHKGAAMANGEHSPDAMSPLQYLQGVM